MLVLLTGCAGFIGFHLAKILLDEGNEVVGIDNLNSYYIRDLKLARLNKLNDYENFKFYPVDISNQIHINSIANLYTSFDVVVHLAAQAGVRYSIENPHAYINSNINGTLNILEFIRNLKAIKHFIFASSSSVYGNNSSLPFSINDKISSPVSLYAATKISGEAMCYSYSNLYNIPTTMLRFFTVYGPWGRPDMATYIFTKAIDEGVPIKLFNNGNMKRDFTYIDDIIVGIKSAILKIPQGTPPIKTYNLGNSKCEPIIKLVNQIEKSLGKKAIIISENMQQGDVVETFANIDDSIRDLGFEPKTSIEEGIPKFVEWYKKYGL